MIGNIEIFALSEFEQSDGFLKMTLAAAGEEEIVLGNKEQITASFKANLLNKSLATAYYLKEDLHQLR